MQAQVLSSVTAECQGCGEKHSFIVSATNTLEKLMEKIGWGWRWNPARTVRAPYCAKCFRSEDLEDVRA